MYLVVIEHQYLQVCVREENLRAECWYLIVTQVETDQADEMLQHPGPGTISTMKCSHLQLKLHLMNSSSFALNDR